MSILCKVHLVTKILAQKYPSLELLWWFGLCVTFLPLRGASKKTLTHLYAPHLLVACLFSMHFISSDCCLCWNLSFLPSKAFGPDVAPALLWVQSSHMISMMAKILADSSLDLEAKSMPLSAVNQTGTMIPPFVHWCPLEMKIPCNNDYSGRIIICSDFQLNPSLVACH